MLCTGSCIVKRNAMIAFFVSDRHAAKFIPVCKSKSAIPKGLVLQEPDSFAVVFFGHVLAHLFVLNGLGGLMLAT